MEPISDPGSSNRPSKRRSGQDLERLRDELSPDLDVLRHLGRGSAAEVFLARDISLDRLVAVKVLSSQLAGDEIALARFEREARAAASVNHPNAVAVYRFGSLSSGVPYLVMEFVTGGTLEDKLAAEGPLPAEDARRILGEVAAALASAHAQGFVHRDVRLGNVLCDREKGRVLVSDFGLAGILPQGGRDDPKLTRTGQIIGNLEYLSPEQLRGDPVTDATDIYALGVLGYEVLTGRGPFPGTLKQSRLPAHGRSEPSHLAPLLPPQHADLAELLGRCLSADPRKRPSASFLAQTFAGEGRGAPSGDAHGGTEGDNLLASLLQRRLPQSVAVTGALGLGLLGIFDMLADRGVLPEAMFKLALVTVICALAGSAVVSWFHGKKGKQRVTPLEVALLILVSLVWLTLEVWVVRF